MAVHVHVEISPELTRDNGREVDAVLNAELEQFNAYFIEKQRERGILDPAPLIGPERGAIKAYLIYAATVRNKVPE